VLPWPGPHLVERARQHAALLALEALHGIFAETPLSVAGQALGVECSIRPACVSACGLERRLVALLAICVGEAEHLVGPAVIQRAGERQDVLDLDVIGEELGRADRAQRLGAFHNAPCHLLVIEPEQRHVQPAFRQLTFCKPRPPHVFVLFVVVFLLVVVVVALVLIALFLGLIQVARQLDDNFVRVPEPGNQPVNDARKLDEPDIDSGTCSAAMRLARSYSSGSPVPKPTWRSITWP